jgi:hypothetical protein
MLGKKASDEPHWCASLIFSLAKETGWPERFIFEELPLARVWAYRHALLRSYDVPAFFASNKEEEARSIFASLTGGTLRGPS